MADWSFTPFILMDGVELGLELGATLVILVAAVRALWRVGCGYARGGQVRTREIRLPFVQQLVLALDFLIAADILRTTATPSLDRVVVLGSIVAIRIVLAFTLTREMRDAERAHAAETT